MKLAGTVDDIRDDLDEMFFEARRMTEMVVEAPPEMRESLARIERRFLDAVDSLHEIGDELRGQEEA